MLACPNICPAMVSIDSLASYLSKILTSPFKRQIERFDPAISSYQIMDSIILDSVKMVPSLSQSLSIPCVPPILECLVALLLAHDEVYSAQTQMKENLRSTLINLSVDDICFRILAAHRRFLAASSSSFSDSTDREYWNTLVKSCLNLLMNMSYRCPAVQVNLINHSSYLIRMQSELGKVFL